MSYEDLKKRVAMLKEVEKQDRTMRKEAAVKEAAEVAKCVSHTKQQRGWGFEEGKEFQHTRPKRRFSR